MRYVTIFLVLMSVHVFMSADAVPAVVMPLEKETVLWCPEQKQSSLASVLELEKLLVERIKKLQSEFDEERDHGRMRIQQLYNEFDHMRDELTE